MRSIFEHSELHQITFLVIEVEALAGLRMNWQNPAALDVRTLERLLAFVFDMRVDVAEAHSLYGDQLAAFEPDGHAHVLAVETVERYVLYDGDG